MAAVVITLADRRVRKLVGDLMDIQSEIDQQARALLSGGDRSGVGLEKLLDEMEGVLKELGRNVPWIERPDLRRAVIQTCFAHEKWSRARLGSPEEREAAATYLSHLDTLSEVAL
jgi:hypothetical protein